MPMRGENWRFWLPVLLLFLFAGYSATRLVCAHVSPTVDAPDYIFTKKLQARRGSIYSAYGKDYPFVKSVPYWEYTLDPVALTNCVVRRRKEPPRPKEAIVKTIADALGLDYHQVLDMANSKPRRGYRNQFLARSSDPGSHKILADSTLVAGVAIHDRQVRQYLHGRRLAHVLGSVNAVHEGAAGIEQRFNDELTGVPGTIQGMRDAKRRELYDKRTTSIRPKPGSDIYLTIDHNIQYEAEDALRWGMREFGAASGWCVVMDSQTGAILAMVSFPDFEPLNYGNVPKKVQINNAIGFNYEPGSVMKVVTVAAAIDAGFASPQTVYMTNRNDPRYYKLPSDGGHDWVAHPRPMTLKEAVVHSSNIVVGKLACDFGSKRLYGYMKKFGFGERTGIELPGEQFGILPDPNKRMWDKASQSRAGIGQFLAVTAIQMVSAYQAIANDGLRLRPYLVDRIVDSDGREVFRHAPEPLGRPISAKTAKTMREVMLDVASPQGTARRAAIRGYSVAGKTGTAQKQIPGGRGYLPGQYRASFSGIVPASDPRLVVFVTLDFDAKTTYHQGGNSAGPVFKRIAMAALRYRMIDPDRPDELAEFADEDEFDKVMDERAKKYGIISED